MAFKNSGFACGVDTGRTVCFSGRLKSDGGRKGFSLVELMVVLAIVGVLAAVTIPSAVYYLPVYRMNNAAREILGNLQLAKITAVRRSSRVVVEFSSGTYDDKGQVGRFRVFLDTNSDWTDQDASGVQEDILTPWQTMPIGVSLYSAVFSSNGAGSTKMVGFDNHGLTARAAGAGGDFVYGEVRLRSTAEKYLRVVVSPVGNVKLEHSRDGLVWHQG